MNTRRLLCLLSIACMVISPGRLWAQELPKRIISLTPATTEILFALGLDDEIAGVSTYCSWPPAAKEKEHIGSFSNPDIEKIISIKPDLVLLTGMEQEYFRVALGDLKIKYLIVDPISLNELIESIEEIGSITGKEREARSIVNRIKDTIRRIKSAVSGVTEEERPRVYVEIWHDPVMSVGGRSFINDMIETAGGINITKGLNRSYAKIDPEEVVFQDPEVIILTYMKNREWVDDKFAKRIGFSAIDAVKNDRVFSDLNPDIILRPGPRVDEGLLMLHERFYED